MDKGVLYNYTDEDLKSAIPIIASMINRSKNVQPKLKEGTSQASLVRNRLGALDIALALITKKLINETYSSSTIGLEKALGPITSTIRKCEKALDKLKEGTYQYNHTKDMIKALYISSLLISKEIKL